jgi:hypothetical protein
MEMVLDRYGVSLKKSCYELRGKRPIHRGSNNKHFTANTSKNVFKCFFAQCDAHGNVLDFVAAMEQCSVKDAPVKLRDWFEVGDTPSPSKDEPLDEGAEIKTGIYSDENGAMYQVIGIASNVERSESVVVYRELFDRCRLLVLPVMSFHENCDPSGKFHFMLVKKL